jgi:hypothetical protein
MEFLELHRGEHIERAVAPPDVNLTTDHAPDSLLEVTAARGVGHP